MKREYSRNIHKLIEMRNASVKISFKSTALLWLGLLKTNITGDQRLSQNLVQVNLSAQSASVRCSICRNILQIMHKYFPNYAQIVCKLFTNILKILPKYFANYAQISFEGRKLSGGEKRE